MNWCYGICHNYGYAIVLFTLISKIILLPVSLWTYFESIKMIKIQPDINMLKVRFYGQRDLIADEQSKLFKKMKYHPVASIIPTILQLILLAGVVGVIKQGTGKQSGRGEAGRYPGEKAGRYPGDRVRSNTGNGTG